MIQEFRNVYIYGANIITNITAALQESQTTSISSSENVIVQAIKEVASEIRLYRRAYMFLVSVLRTTVTPYSY